ncbi:FAD-dependent oxidoreductase [Halomonas korlensis]|uniref:Glycine/D-amino acid oxidase n=1 Tax=Halomonas korlensis TaxID=463301 RepID=A0A1I7KFF5_9GAMM|nr:FAD-dependent oxidoreductase [Halomonas korlensis]SFU96126.1 Glycine/D-amino acid oxidase [Halomonas korlensis]
MEAIWGIGGTDQHHYPTLNEDISADAVVIGAGITGITTALQLADAGMDVVVLEALAVGQGGTGGSTGNLYSTVARGLAPLRKTWDDATIRDVVNARALAIDHIEALVERFGIDCQFHRRVLYHIAKAEDKQILETLDAEREAMRCAGLEVKSAEDAMLPFQMTHGLKIEGQAQFNPLRYVQGLARAVSQQSVRIFEGSPVREVKYPQGVVVTDKATVTAHHIIHATHTPKGINLLHASLLPSREYGIGVKLNSGAYPEGIFFVHDPFHSLRSYRHGDEHYLVVIGEQHKTGEGQADAAYFERLHAYISEHFDVESIAYRWSNQQYSPADGLPYIGRMHGKDNAYLATGFAADGLTWGSLAGMIIADLVTRRDSPWRTHFDSSRFDSRRFTPGKSAMNWARENASVTKHLAKDYLGTRNLKELADVSPGQGKVMTLKGEKLAIYMSHDGELSVLSAVCPHMKCLVHWNGAETSWDCPCHGSRFDIQGEVIEGPAYHPLARREQPH